MRYYKGYISISMSGIFRPAAYSQCPCGHLDQLCGLLAYENLESVRRSVHWRVTRLAKAKLIERFELERLYGNQCMPLPLLV